MNVVVDMFAAEAVVALTAGAVAELKLGMIHIRSAADGTLVVIELGLLLIADTGGFLAEVDCALAGLAGQQGLYIAGAEDEEVQKRHNRHKVHGEGIANHCHDEKHRVNQREELHAHRDDEHEQHLHIRIHGRKGEEHGKEDVA